MKASPITFMILLFAICSLAQTSNPLTSITTFTLAPNANTRIIPVTQSTHIRPLLTVPSDKFFDQLMKPYKGKVVYIDFWAPWCGPCMREMPASKKLQQELKGKDVVFLYIGISCSKASWESTIKDKDLTGEHYFANENEAQLLAEKFNISSIPFYVLVDKQGKVVDGDASRPSDKNKLMKKIDGLLKK